MTSPMLAPTLVGLRRQIMGGEVNVQDALQGQFAALAHDEWNSFVHQFPLDNDVPLRDRPLSGVGLAHKDMFITAGHHPSCGAKDIPNFDALASPLIERLTKAGSATLGMLTMAEFAAGVTGQNENLPLPINPSGANYAVGGSSSGSAVAVAAGLCYGSLGTDTAGSVRIPAATCGVFGLKPSYGVLETQGCYPLAPSLDTVGILSRSALDAALLFAVAMNAGHRKTILPQFSDVIHKLGGVAQAGHLPEQPWRLATATDHYSDQFSANDDVRDAILRVAREFCDGSVAHPGPMDFVADITQKANTALYVEAAATHYQRLQTPDSALSAITRAITVPGAAIPAVWYSLAQTPRDALRQQFIDRYLNKADILLTPILPHGVPEWDHVRTDSDSFEPVSLLALFSWSTFVNYLGLPAVVFPVGVDQNGAPICIQAIGRPYSEAMLLAFAYHVEQRLFGTAGFVGRLPLSHSVCPDLLS